MVTHSNDSIAPWRLRAARALDMFHLPIFLLFNFGWMGLWAWLVPLPPQGIAWSWIAVFWAPMIITLSSQLACRGCPINVAVAALRGEPFPNRGLVSRLYRRFGACYALAIIAVTAAMPATAILLVARHFG